MPLQVMISSVVEKLLHQRQVAYDAVNVHPRFTAIGMKPVPATAVGSSSYLETQRWARECDTYLLLVGKDYGDSRFGKSPTEVEFDAAYGDDPTKIVVIKLKDDGPICDLNQKRFINRVRDYKSGYFTQDANGTDELAASISTVLDDFLERRAKRREEITIADRFVLESLSVGALLGLTLQYSVSADRVFFLYPLGENVIDTFVEKQAISQDFWGELAKLKDAFASWSEESQWRTF